MPQPSPDVFSQLAACRVLPVITVGKVEETLELIAALHRAGMRGVEITLRSDSALECVRAVRQCYDDMLVAVGTVTAPVNVTEAAEAGAQLLVSPGLTPEVLQAAAASDVPLLPGIATASDIMLGVAHGLSYFKFFPAAAAGGIALLRAFQGPFPGIKFCPTGGLNADNFQAYLALPNVICCGGSWMVADDLVHNKSWREIERLAAQAVSPA